MLEQRQLLVTQGPDLPEGGLAVEAHEAEGVG
jgi:hypothetical protein